VSNVLRRAFRATLTLAAVLTAAVPLTAALAGHAAAAATDVKINEVESSGGVPGDWVELYNAGATAVDISGWKFLDNDNSHTPYSIPGGTTLAPGAYMTLEEAQFGFGLGAADSARLFAADGTTVMDTYSWTSHATTTYGRCPNGTGSFTTTASVTKGAANDCGGSTTTTTTLPSSALPWPGDAAVQTVDNANVFGGNLSGLDYEGLGGATPGVIWAARNGPGALFRLVFDGAHWIPDPANSWGAGKLLHYPGGGGEPDAEGVTMEGPTPANGLYVSAERDNSANSISRNSILRFDVSAAGASLSATNEWNLTADLPPTGANLGAEAITWIPDSFLTSKGFFDETKGHTYDPNEYPNHGTGLFFVGLEANGQIYAYALDHTGSGFARVASFSSGFPGVMDLQYDRDVSDLWAVCDDTCQGRSTVLRIDPGTHKFAVTFTFDRPGTMPNLNNEGFTIAAATECVNDRKPVFWSDDGETGGHSLRSGNLPCAAVTGGPPGVVPEFPVVVLPVAFGAALIALWYVFARNRRRRLA
jgi:hypothetical protein